MKKFFAFLFASLAISASALNVKVGDIVAIDDLNYEILTIDEEAKTGTAQVTKSPDAAGKLEILGEFTHYGVKFTVKAIGKFAFYNGTDHNPAITSVVLEEGIEEIGVQAFIGCYKIKELRFPSTLKSIGSSAFYCYDDYKNTVLKEVYCDAIVPPTCESGTFGFRQNASHQGYDRTIPLWVPKGSVQAYREADGWEYFNIITDGEETSTVEEIFVDVETGEEIGGDDNEQGINDVQSDKVQSTKVLVNGQLRIVRGDKVFDATGKQL